MLIVVLEGARFDHGRLIVLIQLLRLELWTDHEPTWACKASQVVLHLLIIMPLIRAAKQGNFAVVEGHWLLKRLRVRSLIVIVLPVHSRILLVVGRIGAINSAGQACNKFVRCSRWRSHIVH